MKRKVLIHTRKLTIPGGKQSYLLAIKEHFTNDITWFYYGSDGPKESIVNFLRRVVGDYIRFYRLLKTEKFDIVHINTSLNLKSFFRDSIFSWISYWLQIKTIIYWHGWRWDFEKAIVRRIQPYFRWTFGKADAMILLATEFVQRIKAYGYQNPVYLQKTVVDDRIMNHVKSLLPVRKNGKINGELTILFLSRVEKAKGIYETLESFWNLKQKRPELKLEIAGTGSELLKVQQFVEDNGMEGVTFLGWLQGEEKIQALVKADLFVLASYSEGMPCSVLEAMAVGLPVVTTNVGGIKDFFEEGQMGLTVRSADPLHLQQQFEKLISDPSWIEKIGKYNRSYAKEEFAAVKIAKNLEKIYEEVLNMT